MLALSTRNGAARGRIAAYGKAALPPLPPKPPRETRPHITLHLCGPGEAEQIADLCDAGLARDAWLPRRQVLGILSRTTSEVWCVLLDGVCAGMAITYRNSILHNLFLFPWARGEGVGSAIVEVLNCKVVRCKTNMRAGDPTAFYERAGFTEVARDVARPHIAIMGRTGDEAAKSAAAEVAAAYPNMGGGEAKRPSPKTPPPVPKKNDTDLFSEVAPGKPLSQEQWEAFQRLQFENEKRKHRQREATARSAARRKARGKPETPPIQKESN